MLDRRRNEHVRVKMMYSLEERVFLVSTYFLTNRNLNAMRMEFGKRFNVHTVSCSKECYSTSRCEVREDRKRA